MLELSDILDWEERRKPNGRSLFVCLACQDNRECQLHHLKDHERSGKHIEALADFQEQLSNATPTASGSSGSYPLISNQAVADDALRALLASATGNPSQHLYRDDHPLVPPSPDHSGSWQGPLSPVTGINWNLLEATENTILESSPLQEYIQSVSQASLDFINGDLSEDELLERISLGSDSSGAPRVGHAWIKFHFVQDLSDDEDEPSATKRPRNHTTDPKTAREWFPWPDRITCTLDELMHLPRSAFSDHQLDLFLWLLTVNGVDYVPSVAHMKEHNKLLQKTCGIDTIPFQGILGHPYHQNSIPQILAQEVRNPRVHCNLHVYPEDAGPVLREAHQGSRWLDEMPSDQTTPMIRRPNGDYYIYEPALLTNGQCCIPIRWFVRKDQAQDVFYAKVWSLEHIQGNDTTPDGWRVRCDLEYEICERDLVQNFPMLSQHHSRYSLPHPSRLLGGFYLFDKVRKKENPTVVSAWEHTNPLIGNRWRQQANGKHVMSLSLWLYCDDTSGNQSKKWNEHNSFLFTLAGLPGSETSKEYNIHFICTSNLAPPLEMLDGVVQKIENAQKEGIVTWDCEHKEYVLIFPTVLALLGDNPMQSEMACHIGLQGKAFCRACTVKRPDSAQVPEANQPHDLESNSWPTTPTIPTTPTHVPKIGSKKKKAPETMAGMVARVTSFLWIGELRTKAATLNWLNGYSEKAKKINTRTALKKDRTESGIKDTIQEHFFNKLFSSYKSVSGNAGKQAVLDAAIDRLPPDIKSAIWRLHGIDPHQDTPVEVLHVILLGFIKYFWRDLIRNELGDNDDKKQLLIQRLSSLDVSGLNISPLNGKTLVQYAGSLTGRDFRHIAQAAPFVIYDLVSPECYDAWISLSKLVPLIWQPEIEDIDKHINILNAEIEGFLLRTALWTNQWFNKPKFHIFIHLTCHIRRFGPAILFATKAFESFNAIIRAKSIHSNRQALSRDIVLAFAQANRIRHLLSGGVFVADNVFPSTSELPKAEMWQSVGPRPEQLVATAGAVTKYLGLADTDKKPHTIAGQKIQGSDVAEAQFFKTGKSVIILNSDTCRPGQSVIVQGNNSRHIACVEEILQEIGSPAYNQGKADALLVQTLDITGTSEHLRMPQLSAANHYILTRAEDVLCTVNTQHECEKYGCKPTGSRLVRQECTNTSMLMPIIKHTHHPERKVLNSAQMRDARHISHFRIPSQPLNFETTVLQSAAKEIDKHKKLENTAGSARSTGRGRGRGRGHGQQTVGHSLGRGQGRGRGHGENFEIHMSTFS
ncbi:hypothetical protein BYT27DRAFT_7110917 [Phlegmacium glaucopus]|nr:hypothetical protein BYT27DRAFT_7110917 [Phlegmacium glaucopus]